MASMASRTSPSSRTGEEDRATDTNGIPMVKVYNTIENHMFYHFFRGKSVNQLFLIMAVA